MDVKTGLLMFTMRRRVSASRTANTWYTSDKLASLQARIAGKAAHELAGDVRSALHRYQEAVAVENRRSVRLGTHVVQPQAGAAQESTTL